MPKHIRSISVHHYTQQHTKMRAENPLFFFFKHTTKDTRAMRERERQRVCLCVREREGVCVRVRERERERERGKKNGSEYVFF